MSEYFLATGQPVRYMNRKWHVESFVSFTEHGSHDRGPKGRCVIRCGSERVEVPNTLFVQFPVRGE